MSIRLQATLRQLAAKGITANDLTADELTALVHACERVDNPFELIAADLMERPVRVRDGLYLWPPTAGAVVWLTEYVEAHWPKKSYLHKWAEVYALKNARTPGAFENLTTKKAIRAAVLKCALSLCVHSKELRRAVELCYGVREWDAVDERKNKKTAVKARTDFAGIVARLEVNSGIMRDEWLWGRSVVSLMKSYGELMQTAAAALGVNKDAQIELDDAVQNLAATIANIRKRIAKDKEAKNEPGA